MAHVLSQKLDRDSLGLVIDFLAGTKAHWKEKYANMHEELLRMCDLYQDDLEQCEQLNVEMKYNRFVDYAFCRFNCDEFANTEYLCKLYPNKCNQAMRDYFGIYDEHDTITWQEAARTIREKVDFLKRILEG